MSECLHRQEVIWLGREVYQAGEVRSSERIYSLIAGPQQPQSRVISLPQVFFPALYTLLFYGTFAATRAKVYTVKVQLTDLGTKLPGV